VQIIQVSAFDVDPGKRSMTIFTGKDEIEAVELQFDKEAWGNLAVVFFIATAHDPRKAFAAVKKLMT
jgi:hypothetical protein